MFFDLIKETRTLRHFDRTKAVSEDDITYVIECARLTPSAANLQRVRYGVIYESGDPCTFSHVAFAGYLADEDKPKANEAATAYLVLLTKDQSPDLNLGIDLGISAEAAVLAAREKGLGACMIRSFDKQYFSDLFADTCYCPQLVIALGYPTEKAKITDVVNGSIKYYKDSDKTNCVPKLSITELLIKTIK